MVRFDGSTISVLQGDLIDVKSYMRMADFGDFSFPYRSQNNLKCDFLKYSFFVDLKSYTFLEPDLLIDSISL